MIEPNIPYLLHLAVEKGVCDALDCVETSMEEQDIIALHTSSVMERLMSCFVFESYGDDEDEE